MVKSSAMKNTNEQHSLPILGLRIFSLFLIYLGHSELKFGGGYGAVFFLVLSGYLFVKQFHLADKDLSILIFFNTRVKKIYPALCVLLVLTLITKWFKAMPIDVVQILSAISFTSNYHNALFGHQQNGLGHLWALAVNMQFCLLFPIIFKWQKSESKIQIALIFLAAFSIAYRASLALKGWGSTSYLYNSFETRADALSLGALCAFWQIKKGSQHLIHFLKRPLLVLLNLIAIFLLGRLNPQDKFVFGQPLMALSYCVLIIQVSGFYFSFLSKAQFKMISLFCLWFYLFHPWGLAIGKKLSLPLFFQTIGGAILLVSFFGLFYWARNLWREQTTKVVESGMSELK